MRKGQCQEIRSAIVYSTADEERTVSEDQICYKSTVQLMRKGQCQKIRSAIVYSTADEERRVSEDQIC